MPELDKKSPVCPDCLACGFPFWEQLTPEEQEFLCRTTRPVKYKKGERVHSPVENCVGILLLRTGQLRAYLLSEDGRDVTLYRLFGGEVCILAASCVMDSVNIDLYIDAEEDTEAYCISAGVFRQYARNVLCAENAEITRILRLFSVFNQKFECTKFLFFRHQSMIKCAACCSEFADAVAGSIATASEMKSAMKCLGNRIRENRITNLVSLVAEQLGELRQIFCISVIITGRSDLRRADFLPVRRAPVAKTEEKYMIGCHGFAKIEIAFHSVIMFPNRAVIPGMKIKIIRQ